MIYKHHSFELLPYGSTCKVKCISSNKQTHYVDEYSGETSFTTVEQNVGLGYSCFIESILEPMEMTFSYTEQNGNLVEILTNLEVNLDTSKKQFTISNNLWFQGDKQEAPYIKLCFNNVKIENCFLDQYRGYTNGFKRLDVETNFLYPVNNENLRCKLARYTTISWNKEETNTLLYTEDAAMNLYHNVYVLAYSRNGTLGHIATINEHNKVTQGYNYKVPRMDGGNKKYIGPYFIGFVVNLGEVGDWEPGSTYYVKSGTYYMYDSQGFRKIKTFGTKQLSVSTNNSIPLFYSVKHFGTNNKSFYYINTDNSDFSTNPYLNAAEGIELESDWDLSCNPGIYDDCPGVEDVCGTDGEIGDDGTVVDYWLLRGIKGDYIVGDNNGEPDLDHLSIGIYNGEDPYKSYRKAQIGYHYFYKIPGGWMDDENVDSVTYGQEPFNCGTPNPDDDGSTITVWTLTGCYNKFYVREGNWDGYDGIWKGDNVITSYKQEEHYSHTFYHLAEDIWMVRGNIDRVDSHTEEIECGGTDCPEDCPTFCPSNFYCNSHCDHCPENDECDHCDGWCQENFSCPWWGG